MAETADTVSPPHSETTSDLTIEEPPKPVDLTKKEESASETKTGGISLRIWPPTQKTRDAVLNRLIETLSTESILSKRYGTLNSEEASAVAKSIEEEAYDVASKAVASDDDGIKILEVYSKEISKRMLETVKDRSATSAKESGTDATEAENDDPAPELEKTDA